MRRALLLVLLPAVLALGVDVAGGAELPPGEAELGEGCSNSATVSIALLCDPSHRLRATLRFPGAKPAVVERRRFGASVAEVGNDREPLLPGEQVRLRVRRSSPRARLLITVAARGRPRPVVLDRVMDGMEVSLDRDLTLRVRRGSRVTTIPPRGVGPPGASAEELGARVVAALGRIFAPGGAGLDEICDALPPATRDGLAQYYGDPKRYGCPSIIYLNSAGGENVPFGKAGSARLVSVAQTAPDEAVLTADLDYRFKPYSLDDPPRVQVRATALLVRTADGSWRLADPFPLLAQNVLADGEPPPLPVDRLRTLVGNLSSEIRDVRRRNAAAQRPRERASSRVGQRFSCGSQRTPAVDDPRGDLTVGDGDRPSRWQSLGRGSDITAARLLLRPSGPPCLVLELARAPAADAERTVTLEATRSDGRKIVVATVLLRDGRVVATDGELEPSYLAGARGRVDGRRLVVRPAPSQWPRNVTRQPFGWSATITAPHPYADTFTDETRDRNVRPPRRP